MSETVQELLGILRYELNFLEQGGYDRLTESGKRPSPFKNSMTCLNYGDPMRPHACRECSLYPFVPEPARTEDVPCHFIPLDEDGHTVANMLKQDDPERLVAALKQWLETTIARLEVNKAIG